MRLLVHCGFFVTTRVHINQEAEEEEAYDLTPSSRILLKDNVTNLSPFLLAMLDPVFVSPWHFLESWFRGDKVTPFESAHGMSLWDYADQKPDFNDSFNKAMTSDSGMMNLVVKDCKPVFEGLDALVDVGGGTGTCARIISEAFPHLKCTVLELPHVVANLPDNSNLNFVGGDMFQSIPSADAILLKPVFEGLDALVDVGGGTGTCARIISEAFPHLKCTVLELPHVVANLPDNSNLNFVGGDMFQSIPSADAILLKLVLHALSDEECVKVLKKCREAISNKGKEGKVIIIDIVIDEKKDEHEITSAKLFFDMLMMVVVTGRERREKEWEKLFVEAGFSHYKIKPLFGLRSLIEPLGRSQSSLIQIPNRNVYLNLPHTTVMGFENNDKIAWVERIMQIDKKDVGTALSVLSTNTSAATFLASVSLTLCSLIGAWIANSSTSFLKSELIYGDTRSSTMSIKYISLLICFLLAFSCFVQSARNFVHANYIISTPDSDIPVRYAEVAVIRGSDFWSLGLRALYFALNLLLWFFGPVPMFVCSILMVIVLHYLDTNTTLLHQHVSPSKQKAKRVVV
nr:trans-resveratrol di-o-methyltransferase [Quercus suber]